MRFQRTDGSYDVIELGKAKDLTSDELNRLTQLGLILTIGGTVGGGGPSVDQFEEMMATVNSDGKYVPHRLIGGYVPLSLSSSDTGKAIDAYTGQPLVVKRLTDLAYAERVNAFSITDASSAWVPIDGVQASFVLDQATELELVAYAPLTSVGASGGRVHIGVTVDGTTNPVSAAQQNVAAGTGTQFGPALTARRGGIVLAAGEHTLRMVLRQQTLAGVNGNVTATLYADLNEFSGTVGVGAMSMSAREMVLA